MPNDVWEFKRGDGGSGKVELVGRMQPKDADPAKLPGASHAVIFEEHTLIVRSADGFADSCRSCGVIGLVKGQMCEFIDKYNDEKHPL